MSANEPHYINTIEALASLVAQLRGAPHLAVDTEFVRERQYYPQLEIIQIATPDVAAILDYRALGSLGPFTDILDDPAILKIFHAADQDLEIFFNLMGRIPTPLFDTQVAAAMVGQGAQIGYSRLVEGLLGVSLTKSQTLTDWTRRPLTLAQIEYALNDVRYLLPVYDRLQEQLEAMGRTEWLDDEWAAMSNPDSYRRVHPREAYRRISGMQRLKPRELALLRELAEWREREAIRRDRAPSLIIRDHLLVELVRQMPDSLSTLKEIRGLHEREVERHGKEILAALQRGGALPRTEWPKLPERNDLSEQQNSLVSLMQSWLRARADEVNIAPHYLATAADLKELVSATPEAQASLGVMRGWRHRLVGMDLLALAEGRAYLAWEPKKGHLRLVHPESIS
ncbi:MAG: ribonuclease D [Ardenticatenales bacterium]|nr:ribonuclease D [Ardenticatenales bacterium]